MVRERIAEIIERAYEKLEEKAVLDFLVPAYRLVRSNITYSISKGKRVDDGYMHSFSFFRGDCDMATDGNTQEAFAIFLNQGWTIQEIRPDKYGNDTVHLEKSHNDNLLRVKFSNEYCDYEPHRYPRHHVILGKSRSDPFFITEITFENIYAEQVSIKYCDDLEGCFYHIQLEISSHNYHHINSACIIKLGLEETTQRLIEEAKTFITHLSAKLVKIKEATK